MKCPHCESTTFERKILTDDLQAMMCSACKGHWINSFQYWLWREKQPAILPEKDATSDLVAQDTSGAKVCPECFKLLHRYQVGHGTGPSGRGSGRTAARKYIG